MVVRNGTAVKIAASYAQVISDGMHLESLYGNDPRSPATIFRAKITSEGIRAYRKTVPIRFQECWEDRIAQLEQLANKVLDTNQSPIPAASGASFL